MSKSLIGALRVSLGLDSAAFTSGLAAAEGRLGGFSKKMQAIGAKMAIVGTAITTAVGGLTIALRGQINAADDMSKAAQKFGVPIETLSRLKYAADLSDVSLETLGRGIGQLSKKMVAAAEGNKSAATMFAGLGVSVTDASGRMRPAEAVMSDVADALAKMPDGAAKTAAAMEIFGKSGAEMIPLLNGGGGALREMAAEADRFGLTISERTGKAAEAFNDNITRMHAALSGLTIQLMAALAPAFETFSRILVDVVQWFAALTPNMQGAISVIAGITVVAGPLLIALGALVGAIGTVASAFAALTAIMMANPIIVAITAIAVGAALIYYNWDSLSAWFKDLWGRLVAGLTFVAKTAEAAAYRMKVAFLQAINSILGSFVDLTQSVAQGLNNLFNTNRFHGMSATVTQDLGLIIVAADDAANAAQSAADKAAAAFSAPRAAMAQTKDDVVAAGQDIAASFDEAAASAGDLGDQIGGSGGGGKSGKKSIKDGLDGLSDGLSGLRSGAKNAFAGLITGADSLNEALGKVLDSMAQMLAQSAADTLFGSDKGDFGLVGKLFGFANGTNFAPGGLTLVGERGPELVNMPRGSQVHTAQETRDMLRGGNGGVSISIDARGAQAGVAEQIEARLRQVIPTIVNLSKSAVADGRRRGNAL